MTRDKKARWCQGCGELEYYGHPLPFRAKVPAYKSTMGTVPGWYALACSPECLEVVKVGIAKDQEDLAQFLRHG